MLKTLKREDISYAAERCWALYQDPVTRCYPVSACQRDMELAFAGELQNKDAKFLGYWADQKLAGVCSFSCEKENQYLRVLSIYAWDAVELALEAFLLAIDSENAGYLVEIAIAPENRNVSAALVLHGYSVAETSLDLRYDPFSVNVALNKMEGIAFLEGEGDDEFEEYALLHDRWFPDQYWKTERLRELGGDWQVVTMREDGEITGALLALPGHNTLEIVGLHAADEAIARKLILGLLQQNEMAEFGAEMILFLVQTENKTYLRAAISCGFSIFGRYARWRKKL